MSYVTGESGPVRFEFVDVNGRVLHVHSAEVTAGRNELRLDRMDFDTKGLILTRMVTRSASAEHKMIVL